MTHIERREGLASTHDAVPWAVLVGLLALAALIRAPGLGVWGFAVDEFYFSRAISFIQDTGLPQFPGGGYYTRGIVVQYLAALPSALVDNRELGVRLVPLLFGLLSVPLFYRLSRQYLAAWPATLCTLILVLSSWHVEFSRFARMYTAFQFLFLAFVLFLHSGYWLGNRAHQILAWLLALLAVFVYEASIFLPILLALALLPTPRFELKRALELTGVIAVLLVVNYLVHRTPFRWIGVVDAFPVDLPPAPPGPAEPRPGPLYLPFLDLFHAARGSVAFIAGHVTLIGCGLFVLVRQLRGRSDPRVVLAVVLAAVLPMFHQFGLLAALLIVIGVARRENLAFLVSGWKSWGAYFAFALGFWSVLALLARNSWLPGAGLFGLVKKTVIQLAMFPQIHVTVIAPFAETVPLWGLLALGIIGVAIVGHLFFKREASSATPLLILIACLLLLGTLRTTYVSTRYSFFVFPLVLILAYTETAALVRWCSGRLAALPRAALWFVPLVLFGLSEDFSPRHLLNVPSEQANFRMGPFRRLANHWYARTDFRTPARFVNAAFEPGDVVVVDYAPGSNDLEVPFVNYIPVERKRFGDVSRSKGTEEAWTGRPLIHDLPTLFEAVPAGSDRSLWLIAVRAGGGGGGVGDVEGFVSEAAQRGMIAAEVAQGVDGSVGVWRVARRPGRS